MLFNELKIQEFCKDEAFPKKILLKNYVIRVISFYPPNLYLCLLSVLTTESLIKGKFIDFYYLCIKNYLGLLDFYLINQKVIMF